jgi:hypothetical protein
MEGADLELFERSLRHAVEAVSGPSLDEALAELGWSEAMGEDPRAAVSLLFSLQGSANAVSSSLDLVVLGALDLSGVGSPVLPVVGRWDPPGLLAGDRLSVSGLGSAALVDASDLLVVARIADEGKDVAVVVPAGDLTLRPVHGLDPQLGLVEVRGTLAVAGKTEPVPEWASAVALAHLALGHELVGASRRMLELAREHALERVQFGQTISGFQAIRHRLADTLVAIETADAVLEAAWLDASPRTAAMAKALAGRGARTAARHCQQVLAGIGFTTEHPLHLSIRRVLVLDQLFGNARSLTTALGTELLESRQLPPLLPL